MVVTIAWVHSWVVVSISTCVLVVLALFILYCLCWQSKESKTMHQFYVLDENGMKQAAEVSNPNDRGASFGFLRNLSSTGLLSSNLGFGGSGINCQKVLSVYERNLLSNDKDFMDSTDIAKQFNHSVLQIEACDEQRALQIDQEDIASCTSFESRNSFYSTYPFNRADSVAETMRSAISYPENLDEI